MNKVIESCYELVQTADKSNLDNLLKLIQRFVKVTSKELKRKKKSDGNNSKDLWWQALKDLDKIDENEKSKRYEKLINTN